MKVTRKKNGFTIRCSDSEFEALKILVAGGEAGTKLQGNAKAGHTRRVKDGDFLRVDVDHRA